MWEGFIPYPPFDRSTILNRIESTNTRIDLVLGEGKKEEGKVNREASRMERSRVGKWRFVTPGKLVARNLEIAKWWRRGERVEEGRRGRQKSIRRNVRLNERNVNHKKLRAFKSPTRWCTFALITLHLSFLPWPPSSWSGSNPGKESSSLLRENSRRTETTSPFPSLPSSFFLHLSFAFRENEYLLHSLPLSFSLLLFPTFSHSEKFPTANRSPSGSCALGDN